MKKTLLLFALFSFTFLTINSLHAQDVNANVEIEADSPPPALPEYVQPPCPVDGYHWCPGYWAYAPTGYYWVPGVWVRPPHHSVFWTPGYWGFYIGHYGWHSGYWGARVGYYGGICYGYGYGGSGYYGGRWEGETFQYNTYVNTVNTTAVHNTYSNNIGINNTVVNHSSFNGEGGVKAEPTAEERGIMKEKHTAPTADQQTHQSAAGQDKKQFYSANKGKPATTAMNSTDGQHFDRSGKAGKDPKAAQEHTAAPSSSYRAPRTKKTSFKSSTKVGVGIKPSRSHSSSSRSSSSRSPSTRSSSSRSRK